MRTIYDLYSMHLEDVTFPNPATVAVTVDVIFGKDDFQ